MSIEFYGLNPDTGFKQKELPGFKPLRHAELLHFDPGEDCWVWPLSHGGRLIVSKQNFNLEVRKLIYENQMHADEATVAVMHPWYWLGDDYVSLKPE